MIILLEMVPPADFSPHFTLIWADEIAQFPVEK